MERQSLRLVALLTANGAALLYLVTNVDSGVLRPSADFSQTLLRAAAIIPLAGAALAYLGLMLENPARRHGAEALSVATFLVCLISWVWRA